MPACESKLVSRSRSKATVSDVRVSKSLHEYPPTQAISPHGLNVSHQIWYKGSLEVWVYFLAQLC